MPTPVIDDITKRTVYISNLSYKRDRYGLKNLFMRYGDVRNIKIIVEPTTNQSRGMAFVEMKTVEQAKAAIAGLNQAIIDGRTTKATWATPQRNVTKRPAPATETGTKRDPNRDLRHKEIQLMKKERNDRRRNSPKPANFVY